MSARLVTKGKNYNVENIQLYDGDQSDNPANWSSYKKGKTSNTTIKEKSSN